MAANIFFTPASTSETHSGLTLDRTIMFMGFLTSLFSGLFGWITVKSGFAKPTHHLLRSCQPVQGCRMTLPVTPWLALAAKAFFASASG